jgi:long-chain acyl-CoA synthetase
MSDAASPAWPVMSIAQAHALLTGTEGSLFQMQEMDIRGQRLRVYRNAPPTLRVVFEAGRAHGVLDCIVLGEERMSFEAQYRAVCALSALLLGRYGLRKGERVAIAMRNLPEWSVAFWAAAVSGAIVVPLNGWLTGPELEYALEDSGSRVLLCDGERLARIAPHRAALGALQTIVVTRAGAELPVPADRWEEVLGRTADYAALPAGHLPQVDIGPEDDATIFYTSGTTGKPKGALGTHRNICTNIVNIAVAYTRGFLRRGEMPPVPDPALPKKAMLLSVPLFHATGCHSILVPSLLAGNKIVLMHRWDPDRALELIQQERITSFGGVPTMAWQIVEHPRLAEFDTSTVENIGYGGAPAAPELVARLTAVFPKANSGNGYGLTETSSVTTQNSAEDYRNRPDSVGVAVPTCDLRVVDASGQDVPAGGIGELWIRGPNIVKGYWNKPEATAEAITDGWFHSGDIARIDDEGFVYILDRAKDMLIRGGENIYCVEVENALYSHPAVVDAAVIGIPHPVLGEEVGAIVQIKDGMQASEAELQAHAATQIAGFKVPVRIEIRRESLPRNANGKILKRELKAAWGGSA